MLSITAHGWARSSAPLTISYSMALAMRQESSGTEPQATFIFDELGPRSECGTYSLKLIFKVIKRGRDGTYAPALPVRYKSNKAQLIVLSKNENEAGERMRRRGEEWQPLAARGADGGRLRGGFRGG